MDSSGPKKHGSKFTNPLLPQVEPNRLRRLLTLREVTHPLDRYMKIAIMRDIRLPASSHRYGVGSSYMYCLGFDVDDSANVTRPFSTLTDRCINSTQTPFLAAYPFVARIFPGIVIGPSYQVPLSSVMSPCRLLINVYRSICWIRYIMC